MAKISKFGGPTHASEVREVAVLVADVEPVPVTVEAFAVEEPTLEPDVSPPATAYDSWLLTPLRDECAQRGLSRVGNKDELIARLVESDAAAEDGEAGA